MAVVIFSKIYDIKITNLNLENNQLESLPAEIGNLINLQTLELESNQLESLPA